MMGTFRKRVFQGRAGVADPVGTDILRAVKMPQCHVVEGIKNGGIHVVAAAHGKLFGFTGKPPGNKLMSHKNVAVAGL